MTAVTGVDPSLIAKFDRQTVGMLGLLAVHVEQADAEILAELLDFFRGGQANARMASLLKHLQADPLASARLGQRLYDILAARQHQTWLAETGVLAAESLPRALLRRVTSKLLPPVAQVDLLDDLAAQLFDRPSDVSWIDQIEPTQWQELVSVLLAAPAFAQGFAHGCQEAVQATRLLAARLAALGVSPAVLHLSAGRHSAESPFLALDSLCASWCAMQGDDENANQSPTELLRAITVCETSARQWRELSHSHGTSLELIHTLRAIQRGIDRLRALVLILSSQDSADRAKRIASLLVELLRQQCRAGSVRHLLRRASSDLAFEITENASKTGEHYVTDNRAQWLAMLRASAGAGLIVGLMAWFKIEITNAHWAPLWEMLAICLNYGLGFVVVHLLHFTIATKQPAMTAALLAARLETDDGTPLALGQMAELVVRMVRTQVVAVLGNVMVAIPAALLIFYAILGVTGTAFVPQEKALHLLADQQPFTSMALIHAAIAGVCLYLAGVASGYYDNKCVHARVSQRIAAHPLLRKVLGKSRTAALAAYVDQNLGALMGNLLFGFMLGGVAFLGFLTGLPIDIRHVTFSSANSALGMAALGWQVAWPVVVMVVLGVALVGFVNLAVSFAMSLSTALRARDLQGARGRLLAKLLIKRLLRRPQDFLWPPQVA